MPAKCGLTVQFQQVFGERVKKRRRELHLTQFELAERLQIKRTALTNIESGTQRTSVFLLAQLAHTLKTSPESFIPNLAEVKTRLVQSQKVSLTVPEMPTLLNNALEELNISLETGSTLQNALDQVRTQKHESKQPKG